MEAFSQAREYYRQRVEAALHSRLNSINTGSPRLNDAVRYASLNGGKRLRAMLVYSCGEMAGVSPHVLDVPACAVELIHCYSLVHDDLPCMDDDDIRRGRPTCHRQFDEATALLAGDAAQSMAFELLASDADFLIPDSRRIKCISVLAHAAGLSGMAGGQSLDMEATDRQLDLEQLQTLHRLKTGALIKASCLLGGLSSSTITVDQQQSLESYGEAIGLAFQIKDDILDVTADSKTLGKTAGSDEKMHKSTYVSLLGLDQAERSCRQLIEKAVESARHLGDNQGMLENLANFVVQRSY